MKNISTSIQNFFTSDGRHFQIVSQFIFLCIGIIYLNWDYNLLNVISIFCTSIAIQFIFGYFLGLPLSSIKSAVVTSFGLTLLLKSDSAWVFGISAGMSIAQKFIFYKWRFHLWNPANFGIIIAIILTQNAWISPAQWGTEALLVFVIGTLGLAVLSNIKRLDTALFFLTTLLSLEYLRTVVYLEWNLEVYFHKISQGSIWLFALFMITDPMTTPNNKWVRRIWSISVAAGTFYLATFHFVNGAAQYILFISTPLVPLLNWAFQGNKFNWINTKTMIKKHAIAGISIMLMLILFSHQAQAFCGFYVAKADATLFNQKSEVILVRDGNRTVITMSNDYKGELKDFAIVVPVPVVLQDGDIKVVSRHIFQTLDGYSSPRLVEYYDQNPCYADDYLRYDMYNQIPQMAESKIMNDNVLTEKEYGVTVEATYEVGEYSIAILSAKESEGLKAYLIQEGYKIPSTAESVLAPYIKSNMKFFVAKVNLDRQKSSGFDYLHPIQIQFEHEKFMLPIRLGMANSTGEQDMIVYAFTKSGRVECTNYRTVKIPTDRHIPLYAREMFGEFYKNVFQRAYSREGKNAVHLEYAWTVTPSWGGMKCDPCVGPPPIYNDFAEAGVWWAQWNSNENVFFTRLHVRYSNSKFPSDLQFQVTPNNEHFQARYILTHPAPGPFTCDEGQAYLESLRNRRKLEVDEMYALGGFLPNSKSEQYINEFVPYMNNKPSESKDRGENEFKPFNYREISPSSFEVDMAYVNGEKDNPIERPTEREVPWDVPVFVGSILALVFFIQRFKIKI